MQSIFWFLTWFALFAWLTPVPSDQSVASSAVQKVELGKSFELTQDASAILDNGKLAITFERVVEDSRCPADVTCVWAGMAVVALRVEVTGVDVQTLELGGFTDYNGALRAQPPPPNTTPRVTVAGYTVELLAVKPYPGNAAHAPAEEEYVIALVAQQVD